MNPERVDSTSTPPVNNLRALRLRKRVSQRKLAARSGMSQAVLSLIERSARDPRITTALRIARAMGETLDAIWPLRGKRLA